MNSEVVNEMLSSVGYMSIRPSTC